MSRTPVLPEATGQGALPAQLRRPRPRSATSAIRRFATFNPSRRMSVMGRFRPSDRWPGQVFRQLQCIRGRLPPRPAPPRRTTEPSAGARQIALRGRGATADGALLRPNLPVVGVAGANLEPLQALQDASERRGAIRAPAFIEPSRSGGLLSAAAARAGKPPWCPLPGRARRSVGPCVGSGMTPRLKLI